MTFKIFIEWNNQAAEAAEVCKYSLLTHSTMQVEIHFLKQKELVEQGICPPLELNNDSSSSTVTRFLIPHLCEYTGWAVFVDCNFLFQHDIRELFQEIDDNIAVHVTQPPDSKNNSSLVLFNCSHPDVMQLTPDMVNSQPTQWLNEFEWTEHIEHLDNTWNWLVNYYNESDNGVPKALHYVDGGPWLPDHEKTEYGSQWTFAYYQRQKSIQPMAPPSKFDTVSPEITELFNSILEYRVDPAGDYYPDALDQIKQGLEQINNTAVYAVEADTMNEINESHKKKGADYDPYLKSFIQGSGGQITVWDRVENSMVPIVLRGVAKKKYMSACEAASRDYYYIDTGYFGNDRKKEYHRITKNAMQNLGPVIDRPRDRLAATGYRARKFRGGSNILLAPPSQKLLSAYDIDLDDWLQETQDRLRLFTDREIIIREKASRRVRTTTETMEMALDRNVHCLVTFSSIAAVEAVLLGKPAIVLGPSAAHSVCSHDCSDIETPFIPTLDEVEEWAAHLAYCQFTEVEMRDGTAWRILNENA